VVLYNGGGRATADAPPELRADESHARSARLGVWRE
jgi:penicillin-binding protein 1A